MKIQRHMISSYVLYHMFRVKMIMISIPISGPLKVIQMSLYLHI